MTRPLAALLLILATLAAAVPAAAQTPVASPAPGGFVLVATIEADAWVEPLPEAMPGVDLGDRTLLERLREGADSGGRGSPRVVSFSTCRIASAASWPGSGFRRA